MSLLLIFQSLGILVKEPTAIKPTIQEVFDAKPTLAIEDILPTNLLVENAQPKNINVEDTQPKSQLFQPTHSQLFEQVLTVGMATGIPPHTYPELGTVESPFSP